MRIEEYAWGHDFPNTWIQTRAEELSPMHVCSSCHADEWVQLSRRPESAQWKIKLNLNGSRTGVVYSKSFACMKMILCWCYIQNNTLPSQRKGGEGAPNLSVRRSSPCRWCRVNRSSILNASLARQMKWCLRQKQCFCWFKFHKNTADCILFEFG